MQPDNEENRSVLRPRLRFYLLLYRTMSCLFWSATKRTAVNRPRVTKYHLYVVLHRTAEWALKGLTCLKMSKLNCIKGCKGRINDTDMVGDTRY